MYHLVLYKKENNKSKINGFFLLSIVQSGRIKLEGFHILQKYSYLNTMVSSGL